MSDARTPAAGLRIGIDVSAIPAEPRGAGRYVVALVRALSQRGVIDLHLATRRGDSQRWSALAPHADIRAVVPDARWARLAWEQTMAPRFVQRWGIAVHHGPHYTMPERAKVPKVVTVHDLTYFDAPELHERSKVALFTRAIRIAARKADAIICVSEQTAARLDSLLAPDCPVFVVRHGIDGDLFTADGDEVADTALRAGAGVTGSYLLFLGTLEPRKDVATLVEAFNLLAPDHPGLSLVVAGGTGWANQRFDEAVAASPAKDRIVRTGYVADAVVAALLRGATAVVYPALIEGFGLPALEALACGAPLVTTRGSVMDELTAGAAWLAPPSSPVDLAAAIDEVINGSRATEVGSRRALGLDVAANFTWDATAAGHERVYAAVAGTPRRHR